MAEKTGLDAAGQQALRSVFDIVIGDIKNDYKEHNFAGWRLSHTTVKWLQKSFIVKIKRFLLLYAYSRYEILYSITRNYSPIYYHSIEDHK